MFKCKSIAGMMTWQASGAPIDMVYVSAGFAMMGAERGDLSADSNTKPYHLVYLDAFYIDNIEGCLIDNKRRIVIY